MHRHAAAFFLLSLLVPVGCGGGSEQNNATGTATGGAGGSGGSAASSGTGGSIPMCNPSTMTCCDPATKPAPESCGLNGRGTQDYICAGSAWVVGGGCIDPDQCKDGDKDTKGSCGPNSSGQSIDTCVNGTWKNSCVGADVCTNGTTKPGTQVCGYAGKYQQLCQGGVWVDTNTCADPHPDDAALLAKEAAKELSFQCFAPPLTSDEMILHFPDGSASWTPDAQTRSSTATMIITRYTRSCNQVTGCGAWTYIVGSGDEFYIGYVLGADGSLYLWQGKSEPPGYKETFLPITNGMTTATLSTDELNFGEPQRFLVKVAPGCISLSTLVSATSPDAEGKWTETVYGTLEQWSWTADPHPVPEPIPVLSPDPCPKVTTTITEIAKAWLGPGQSTKYLGFTFWNANGGISKARSCTPYTSCTLWQDDSDTLDPVLKVVGTGLQLSIDTPFTVNADGTFGDAETYGYMTPTCLHAWRRVTTPNPGGLAGGDEVARETVITNP
ncbi:MAG: hypothetical protein QM820_00705 [Minicystis sp.]